VLLNLPAEHFTGRPPRQASLTKVDEREGVPAKLRREESRRFVELGNGSTSAGRCSDAVEHGVFFNPAEPILRVGKVGFPPMHQSMPVAPGAGTDFLADFVRFVEGIVIEPNTRQASGCHLGVFHRVRCERFFNRKRCENGPGGLVGTTRIKRAELPFPKKLGEYRAVGVGIKGGYCRHVHHCCLTGA